MPNRLTSRQRIGNIAEQAVVEFLQIVGWQVVARNLRMGPYELDVVARDGSTLVVVEVRYRGHGALTTGFGSLSPTKRMRVRRAGERLWHRHYRNDETVQRMRFDAASVHFDSGGRAVIEYAMAAF